MPGQVQPIGGLQGFWARLQELRDRLTSLESWQRALGPLQMASGQSQKLWGPYTVATGTLAAAGSQNAVTLTLSPAPPGAVSVIDAGIVDGAWSHQIGWRHNGYNPGTHTDLFTFMSLGPNANASGTLTVFYIG